MTTLEVNQPSLFSENTDTKIHSYILKKKDKPILKFSLIESEIYGIDCEVKGILADESLIPKGMVVDPVGILNWLDDRFIPKNRAFVNSVLDTLLSDGEEKLPKLLNLTLGLSLNDDYWVLTEGLNLKWKDYNLYSNDFSEVLSLVAFTGYNYKANGLVSSPEFTTDGMLRKCWRRIDGKVYLFKGGTEGYANAGNEPYSEYYASQVAKVLELDYVHYDLEMWKGILCSVCELFTSEEMSFIPAYHLYDRRGLQTLINTPGPKFRDKLLDMILFDLIIGNNDRHFGNFGFLMSNVSGEIVEVAPIFDNGYSLLHQSMSYDIRNYKEYFFHRTVSFLDLKFNSYALAGKYLTPGMRRAIRKLFDFEFKKHPRYNVDDDRLAAMAEFVRNQARNLL